MATATARVPVLMTETEKAQIVKKAKQAGLSVGEYMRRAADSFSPSKNDEALDGLIAQMLKATDRAERAINEALDYCAASNKRITTMEARKDSS